MVGWHGIHGICEKPKFMAEPRTVVQKLLVGNLFIYGTYTNMKNLRTRLTLYYFNLFVIEDLR